MKYRLIIALILACVTSKVIQAQSYPQFSFYGASQAEELFHKYTNDYDRYLSSKLYYLLFSSDDGEIDNGSIIALYNMYLYEYTSTIKYIASDKSLFDFLDADFGSELIDVKDYILYFESPVKKIDPLVFSEDLQLISFPKIKGIIYESSPDIRVDNLSNIDGYNVIDHKVLLDDNNKMIVAATAGDDLFVIPDGIEHIGEGALRGSHCSELVIPASVKSIGEKALDNCPFLRSIQLNSSTPGEYLTPAVFGTTPLSMITFYVPKASLKDYKKKFPSFKKQFKAAKL